MLTFPTKLHQLLCTVMKCNLDHIISWTPDGSSFRIHDRDGFVSLILPSWFGLSKWPSFQRQLNLYKFNRLDYNGVSSYYHHSFHRDCLEDIINVRRIVSSRLSNRRSNSLSLGTKGDYEKVNHSSLQLELDQENYILKPILLNKSLKSRQLCSAENQITPVYDTQSVHRNTPELHMIADQPDLTMIINDLHKSIEMKLVIFSALRDIYYSKLALTSPSVTTNSNLPPGQLLNSDRTILIQCILQGMILP